MNKNGRQIFGGRFCLGILQKNTTFALSFPTVYDYYENTISLLQF